MNGISAALSALAAGIVLQNVILARAFCTDDLLHSTRSYTAMLHMGYATTAVTMAAMVLAWLLRLPLGNTTFISDWRWLIYMVCVLIAMVLLHALPGSFRNVQWIKETTRYGTYTAICSMAYGILLITMANYTSLLQSMLYAFGCCIGMVAAQMLIHAGHERIGLCAVPKSFTGMPILLIYIGILSLAIYGLVGHQLTT